MFLYQQSEATAAQRRVFVHLVDAIDGITPETGEAAGQPQVSKNGAAFGNTTATLTSVGNGLYYVELTAGELDTVGMVAVRYKSANTAEAQVLGQVVPWDPYDSVRLGMTALPNAAAEAAGGLYTRGTGAGQINQPANGQIDVNVEKWNTTDVPAEHTAGYPIVTVKDGTGTGEIDTASGRVAITEAQIDQLVDEVWDEDATAHQTQGTFGQAIGDPAADTNTIYKAVVTDAAGATVGVDVVAVQADTDDIQTRLPAALVGGRMDSSVGAYAPGMTPIRPSASGTADSGSTTTVVDTERTEADTDYWKGCLIKFTSGTLNGQTRLITAFDAGTDTLTFAPALTVAAGTHTYEIYPAGRVDLHFVLGILINALISGRIDANTQAMANDVITAAVIATGAIDADAIADNAIDAGAIATDAITAAKIANGAIDAATFAAGAIDAAAIATDAIDGDALAASALTEIKTQVTDALNVDTYAEIGQETPAATQTIRKMLGFTYKAWRNRSTQTSTQYSLYNDDATTIAQKATVSDDATTFDKGEVATGP